ncbi:MAG: hypothetical protein EHM23_08450 [Acidobacteria bacterium]|nr:MAG: hypothetical protein EHM23_08450 [Acidobacteriota bacterium]
MKRVKFLFLATWLTWCLGFPGARPRLVDSAALKLHLKKLTVVGNVLYVAAHPDDENAAVLAYLSRGRLLRTGYLSLTRGDGGQNLIGSEQGALLGVIRTHELLAARDIDGAEQFFTRAVDFGYSKTSEETLRLWGRGAVLSDVVWVIRRFQPDVIITRFTPETGGHGNHTASAILAEEAFEAAADPKRFPEQLKWVKPWKAKRLLWNMYNWGRYSEAERSGALSIDVGEYNPLLGSSYRELAGESRTMHKSQGMGAPEGRGSSANYFKHVAGEPAKSDILEGVDFSWARIPGGEPVGEVLQKAWSSFEYENPSAVVPLLVQACKIMQKLPGDPLVRHKMEETLEAIRLCSGLWLEAVSNRASATPGQQASVDVTAINRSGLPLRFISASIEPGGGSRQIGAPLADNVPATAALPLTIPFGVAYTQPFWLARPGTPYLYSVEDQQKIGLAESPPPFRATVRVALDGYEMTYEIPVLYRWVDPVEGERYRVFEVEPEFSVRLDEPVTVFANGAGKTVRVSVTNRSDGHASATLSLKMPPGWSAAPSAIPLAMTKAGESRDLDFRVSAAANAGSGPVRAVVEVGGRTVGWSVNEIQYLHIPVQTVLEESKGTLLRLDLKKVGQRLGYIMGPGDFVPEALRQIGYEVRLLSDEELAVGNLSLYDAIVVGIRAYNTRPVLSSVQSRLLDYVSSGGTLVVQYNTLQDLIPAELGPYPFRVSRERVSGEEAPVRLTASQHPLLTTPNRITSSDFEGWVQERGLYFPGQWDSRYETVISTADPGEPALEGGVLYSRFGEGVYIYTSYAWFRQLPAGVPGAYRFFANLVSARGSKNGS